jgi:hypothetical protein
LKNITIDNLVLARRIRAGGIPIYIAEDDGETSPDPSSGLLIYQIGGLDESRAFEFYGGAGYVIHATITNKIPRFAIAGFSLELPWKSTFQCLEASFETNDRSAVYRFGGKEVTEFDKDEVLNHNANVQRTWHVGESIVGNLLGIGDAPIPDQFGHGATIAAFLIIYDQFWREYRSSISLWTERAQKPVRHDQQGMRRKGRLFDHKDLIARR